MNFEETVRFLEGSALFADVTPEQLRAVAASATIENHPAGSIIIEEDAPSDYFYLIVDGKVDIYREEKHLIQQRAYLGSKLSDDTTYQDPAEVLTALNLK